MHRYLLRRFLTLIPTVLGVSLLTFVLMYMVPGGPLHMEGIQSPESLKHLERIYNLDRPLHEQYFIYLGNALRGDFGTSFRFRDVKVSDIIAARFPVSAQLGLSALGTVLVGVPLGVIGAVRQNTAVDYLVMFIATVGYSMPNFVVSLFLLIVFAVTLSVFPVGGWGSPLHVILPAIALGLPWMSLIARLTRANMLDVLGQDYIRTARGKGLTERVVVFRHALRNAAIPLITMFGVFTARLIVGSMPIEIIFNIPGLGQYMVRSIQAADYSMIMGLALFFSFIVMGMNLLVDVTYSFIDPRIKYD